MTESCPNCASNGRDIRESCHLCHGSGRVERRQPEPAERPPPVDDVIRRACQERVAALGLHARVVAELAGIANVQHVIEFLAGRSAMTTARASLVLTALDLQVVPPDS